jgi:glycosyltransferase involved in cell wall biosynthesis
MRILYYNWVDYLDDENRGGGVTVYQRNLLRELGARPGVEVSFLSSGISYDFLGGRPRWDRVRHGTGPDHGPRYEIINSGVLSPAHHSFGNPAQVAHAQTEAAFYDFVDATGPYDVIHFNNLEGLPAEVLGLKSRWPATRVILSLHNYYPICPQVNLWRQERECCTDFKAGARCLDCLPHKPGEHLVRKANGLAYRLKRVGIRPGTRAFDVIFRGVIGVGARSMRTLSRLRPPAANGADPAEATARALAFAERRDRMRRLINAGCDRVLCVSDRVRVLAEHYGLDPALLQTSYIGTREAAEFERTAPRAGLVRADGTLGLGYLGYMRRDKGFFFLLDALESLPDEIAGRLHLLVAARRGPAEAMARIEALRPRLAGLRHVDGYGHDDLDDLLGQVDLGLVPVLWEDNLPQVAIEMHARHIPLLTSDMGGAQELAGAAALVFRAGDKADFTARLFDILEGGVSVDAYWQAARPPTSMQRHLAELDAVYGVSRKT